MVNSPENKKPEKIRKYFTPEYEHGISAEELKGADQEIQKEVMESWFYQNYEDPAEHTPYESAEGGYAYIWGGPYDAQEELMGEFENVVPTAVIEELSKELNNISFEWSGKITDELVGKFIIGIRDNAFSSLRHGIEHFIEEKTTDNLKFSILHIFHALELFLKARLAMAHPLLIYNKPEEKIDDDTHTVNFDILIKRLENAGVTIAEKNNLKFLQKVRNCIEHHQVEADIEEVKDYVGRVAKFLDGFLKQEFNINLKGKIGDELYKPLADAIYSYEEQLRKAKEELGDFLRKNKGHHIGLCSSCANETIALLDYPFSGLGIRCFFCGDAFIYTQCNRCGQIILSGGLNAPYCCDSCGSEL